MTSSSNIGIVVTYSDVNIDLAIQSLLIQFYPILISTLLSINRQQLSLFDVDFALLISSSPLVIYLSFASVCDLRPGAHTGLFKRIKSYPHIIRLFGAFVPVFWTVLSLVESFSATAFLDSSCQPKSTKFGGWLKDSILSVLFTLISVGMRGFPGVGLVFLLPFLWLLFRRRSQVWADVQRSLGGASRIHVPLTWVKCALYVPILMDPRLATSNARKAHYRQSTQVDYSSPVRGH